jgi:hypothetical protein
MQIVADILSYIRRWFCSRSVVRERLRLWTPLCATLIGKLPGRLFVSSVCNICLLTLRFA